ncbi:MAG TPA: SPFH domain-containing protein [Armatimonadota bacterium]|nr:SPFH domain-containing protein [Armatimonadota bacterium]
MDLLDVIEWQDTTGTEIVHRWPAHGPGDIRLGAQLTVRESQSAVFFRDGKAMDTFGAGRHTLETANVPLLNKLINIPFGGDTPFQAEVYFVNMRAMNDLKWGTRTPIVFRDSELSMVRLRAFGMFTCRVAEPSLFVNKVVGTESKQTETQIESWMRDFIVARFNDTLGEALETILDLPKYYDEVGVAVRERCREDFDKFGIELLDLLIEAITPPEEVQKMIDQRASMEVLGDLNKFTQFKTAQAIGDMANQPGGGGGGMQLGAGLGAGMGMGQVMAGAMGQAMQQNQPAEAGATAGAAAGAVAAGGSVCGECQGPVPAAAKFCPGCGAKQAVAAPAHCTECRAEMVAGAKFCGECGTKSG